MYVYVIDCAKTTYYVPKLNSTLLLQFTDTLSIIYLSPLYNVLNVNWLAFWCVLT